MTTIQRGPARSVSLAIASSLTAGAATLMLGRAEAQDRGAGKGPEVGTEAMARRETFRTRLSVPPRSVAYLDGSILSDASVARVGQTGSLPASAFSLRPVARMKSRMDGAAPGLLGLKITVEAGARTWLVSKCARPHACVPLSRVEVGKETTFVLGGTAWQLQSLVEPVRSGTVGVSGASGASKATWASSNPGASAWVPSWSMEARARYLDGSQGGAPRRAFVVSGSEGLGVVDADTGRAWTEIALAPALREAFARAGGARAARWDSEGRLTVEAASAAVVFDFERDSAHAFTPAGVLVADAPLAALADSAWRAAWTRPSRDPKPERLLAALPGAVVWNEGIWSLAGLGSHTQAPRVIVTAAPQGLLAARVGGEVALGEAEGRISLLSTQSSGVRTATWTLSTDDGAWSKGPATDLPVRAKQEASYVLMEGSVLQRTSGGVYLLTKDGERATSLTGQTGDVRLDGHRGALVRMGAGKECAWRHFLQHPSVAFSFSESGLEVPCGDMAPALSGSARASVILHEDDAGTQATGVARP